MYQEYIDFVKSKTNHELGLDLIDSLSNSLDISLMPIINNTSLSFGEKKRQLSLTITEKLFANYSAYELSEGINNNEERKKVLEHLSKYGTIITNTGDIEEPNITYTQKNARIICQYEGDAIKSFVYGVAKRFENLAKKKSNAELAIGMISGGLISFSLTILANYVKALIIGFGAFEALALTIKNFGFPAAIAAIVTIIVEVLLWLFIENERKILGLIFNDTDHHLVVENWKDGTTGYASSSKLYMNHGEMNLFPSDHPSGELDKPKIQINKRMYINEHDKNPEKIFVSAGIYHASKCFGLVGVEGVMILSSTDSDLKVAHEFAVPYVADNGTYMRFVNGKEDFRNLHHEMYELRKQVYTETKGNYKIKSSVNSTSGGCIGLIACITEFPHNLDTIEK